MANETFSGDKKDGVSMLHRAEERLKAVLLPCVPQGIETYHLTMTTVLWSILVILFSWLATFNRQWMWGVSGAIVAQYITDLLDGAIGRHRETGLIKWGFYMDHFLDYVFLCAMLIGYSLLIPNHLKYVMFFVMAVFCGFMVNSFLQFAATNKFRIAYWGIGPTEMRLVFIIINTLIVYVNQALYVRTIPYVLGIATFGLFFTAFNTQRQLWAADMEAKARHEGAPEGSKEDLQGLILRHFLLSFVIASLAFLVLVAQIGAPFHRVIAAVIYATSWLPAISAFTHKSWIHVKQNPWVRRYIPLALCATILVLSAWVVMNLRPAPASGAYAVSEMRLHVAEDMNTIANIDKDLQGLFAQSDALKQATSAGDLAPLKEHAAQFMQYQQQLTAMQASYEGYHTIDRQEDSLLHEQAFLVHFSAMAIQQNSVLSVRQLGTSDQVRSAMSLGNMPNDKQNDVYDTLLRSAVLPNTLVKIGYGATYLRLITGEKTNDVAGHESMKQLRTIARAHTDAYYEKLENNSSIFLDALSTLTHPM